MMLIDMQDYLVQQELGIPFIAGWMPDTPTDCITLYEYAGLPIEYSGTATYSMQMMLRTAPENFNQNYTKFVAASEKLLDIGKQDGQLSDGININGNFYLNITTPNAGVNQLGKDNNGNPLLSKNFYITIGGLQNG